MLVPHQLSQGSFGRVLSLRDDQTGQIAMRPVDGKTKVITYTEDDVVVSITPRDEQAAQTFGAMQISLYQKTWDKTVPDIDPLWQAWLDADRITDELLADVPEASEAILARDLRNRQANEAGKLHKDAAPEELRLVPGVALANIAAQGAASAIVLQARRAGLSKEQLEAAMKE